MGTRITRKQLKQNEFVSVMDSMVQWFTEHWKPIAAAACLLVVAFGVWSLAMWWSSNRSVEATEQLNAAIKTYEGDANDSAVTPKGDPAAAEEQLRSVIADHGRTAQADEARLYLARILLQKGETEEARDLLVKITDRHRDDALGRVAMLDLIHLRIASGQAAEVATELETMVVGENPSLPRDVALYELGTLYIKEQQLDKAREYLEKLVEELPSSPYSSQASQRISELE